MKRSTRILALALFVSVSLSGCNPGLVQLISAGEYGVIFNALPRWLGGGVSQTVVQPGEWRIKFPWRRIYVMDTTLQTIGWGSGTAQAAALHEYVETRSVDGNEVGLAIEIQYRMDPTKVAHIVQNVGASKEQIQHLVAAVARADIRTHLNVLTTSDFFTQNKRDNAVQRARAAMNARLGPEGIIVERVIFRDYKFERAGEPGQAPDRSYQEQIDETQATIQQIEQEEKRRAALVEAKGQEYAVQDGERLRTIAWAKGYSRQARVRGDSYLEQKKNEAAQVQISGTNEVEGVRKRIAALGGPGGEAILRLEIAKSLAQKQPRFVLLNSSGGKDGSGGGIELNRIDTNELLRQAGIFSALVEPPRATPVQSNSGPGANSAPSTIVSESDVLQSITAPPQVKPQPGQ